MDIPQNDTPRRSRRRNAQHAALGIIAMVAAVAITIGALAQRKPHVELAKNPPAPAPAGNVGPYVLNQDNPNDPHNKDAHWHAALGVYDCDHWMGDTPGSGIWKWPNTTPTDSPARAADHNVYAGLHSHDDGIIHMEPATSDDAGMNATIGRYFEEGGWKVSEKGFDFLGVKRQNGDACKGGPGRLHLFVNGAAQGGDPAGYKLSNFDQVIIAFIPDNASWVGPPPSFQRLADATPIKGTIDVTVAPNGELRYQPNRIVVTTGRYHFRVHVGAAGHSLGFDDDRVGVGPLNKLDTGKTVTETAFFPVAGDYVFYDTIPGHRQAGEQGVIHVTGDPVPMPNTVVPANP